MRATYSEFFTDRRGDVILITEFVDDEMEKLIDFYLNYPPSKRCCGLPPSTKKGIESWLYELKSRGRMFIAKRRDKIVGHIAVVVINSAAEFAIFIHPEYEGRYIGRELIKFAERFLRYSGVSKLVAVTELGNSRALKLYKDLGFKIAKRGVYVTLEKELT